VNRDGKLLHAFFIHVLHLVTHGLYKNEELISHPLTNKTISMTNIKHGDSHHPYYSDYRTHMEKGKCMKSQHECLLPYKTRSWFVCIKTYYIVHTVITTHKWLCKWWLGL